MTRVSDVVGYSPDVDSGLNVVGDIRQERSGGDRSSEPMIGRVPGVRRERETLRRQVPVLSAEGRISVLVLTVLPDVDRGVPHHVDADYLRVLTSSAV